MKNMDCIAMILAGGQGKRLGALTKNIPKPAVSFGGEYRLIDFSLSNCINSNIDVIGILTQYRQLELFKYIGTGAPWSSATTHSKIRLLPPRIQEGKMNLYQGTADAIYQNIDFIDQYSPENILILSGDHIYKMNYEKMYQIHKDSNAAITIAVLEVPWHEASRFGIINTDENNNITEFEEKPQYPKNNLASMGVYLFNTDILKKYLSISSKNPTSNMDFGKDIIPQMLLNGEKMCIYKFDSYWKDVGTIRSLWETNMELLSFLPDIHSNDDWKIINGDKFITRHFISKDAKIEKSFIAEGCEIYGTVKKSVVSAGACIGEHAKVVDSIIMPGAKVGNGALIYKSIIGLDSSIGNYAIIGDNTNDIPPKLFQDGITVIGNNINIGNQIKIPINFIVENHILGNLESNASGL